MFYADGSALRLIVETTQETPAVTGTASSGATQAEAASWRAWLAEHEERLVVSEVGLTDLRRAADPLGAQAREVARQFPSRVTVLRISDQAFPVATLTEAVLGPFAALHLGLALAAQDVRTLVTYDRDLARLARMHSLEVLTPGRAYGWWE